MICYVGGALRDLLTIMWGSVFSGVRELDRRWFDLGWYIFV